MTDAQLAVLLEGIQKELDTAIAAARALLAKTLPTILVRRHIASPPECFDPFGMCKNPEHYANVGDPDPVVELAAIDAVSAEIGYRIELLTKKP